jgi:hypothetical protein
VGILQANSEVGEMKGFLLEVHDLDIVTIGVMPQNEDEQPQNGDGVNCSLAYCPNFQYVPVNETTQPIIGRLRIRSTAKCGMTILLSAVLGCHC